MSRTEEQDLVTTTDVSRIQLQNRILMTLLWPLIYFHTNETFTNSFCVDLDRKVYAETIPSSSELLIVFTTQNFPEFPSYQYKRKDMTQQFVYILKNI
jgi:hypothetical protein